MNAATVQFNEFTAQRKAKGIDPGHYDIFSVAGRCGDGARGGARVLLSLRVVGVVAGAVWAQPELLGATRQRNLCRELSSSFLLVLSATAGNVASDRVSPVMAVAISPMRRFMVPPVCARKSTEPTDA
jgi:hypothetical protein